MEQLKNWIGDLLDGINISQNRETCIELLKNCGANCAKRQVLPKMAEMKNKLFKLNDPNKIAEIISQHTGAECNPVNSGFIVTYNRGKGCDCSLVNNGYVSSPVFCNCTLGFHEMLWSTVFERPVAVELIETFLKGGSSCSQKIIFK